MLYPVELRDDVGRRGRIRTFVSWVRARGTGPAILPAYIWSKETGSNRRRASFQPAALPTELPFVGASEAHTNCVGAAKRI